MVIALCCFAVVVVDYMVIKFDILSKHFNFTEQGSRDNTRIGHILTGTGKLTFIADADNSKSNSTEEGGSLNFTYSEVDVRQYAFAIHRAARKHVNIEYGRCEKRLPTCIIIGNFKCGTRELIDFMAMHPRIKILFQPRYELEFFVNYYREGLEWYRRAMPCSYPDQLTVVKAPSYLQNTYVASRIHKMNPDIKLIAMFREPVSRTLSHFTFNDYAARYKYNLMAAVVSNKTGQIYKNSAFIRHSIYDEGLARFLKYFDRNQIKIIDINDFKRSPYKVLCEVEEFLHLEHTILQENIVFNEEKGFYCLRKDMLSKSAACYQSDRGRNGSDTSYVIKTSPEFIAKLKAFFKPHNENFFKLAGRKFEW